MQKTKYIWFEGKFLKWEDAKVHILTHTLHYGLGVFEGIRVYKTINGLPAIFRLKDHVKRLLSSAAIAGIEVKYSQDDIIEIIKETVKINSLEEGYIRPIIIIGDDEMGLWAYNNPVYLAVAVWPWGTYLGEEGLRNGVKVKISSFMRHHVNSSMTKAKICGYYVNSILAKKEARELGFDEAILLDTEGYVSEGAGENVFIVRDGEVKTTSSMSILEGITRDTVIKICSEMNINVIQQRFTRDEIYIAEEAFLTGTAAEITPIQSVDGRRIGKDTSWPITRKLQDKFFKIVRGGDESYLNWLYLVK